MAYTLEQIQAIVVKAGCCASDLAYTFLNTERYNTNDVSCAKRKVQYINNAINVLCRYQPVRGVINATYTIQVVNVTPPTQEITLTIMGIIVINHKVYSGTAAQIATQITADVNEFFYVNQKYEQYNVVATTGTTLSDNNVVYITYGSAVGGRQITVTYNVADIHVTPPYLIPINVPVPAITETCLTDDQIQDIVEQLNKECGCCDCQDNSDIIKDIN